MQARLLLLLPLSLTIAAQAEQAKHDHAPHVSHVAAEATHGTTQRVKPREVGQSAFAAIQEIVSILDADPNTDWSRVDMDALRRHLVDMNNVILYSESEATRSDAGMQFTITGNPPIRASIRRMVRAHAVTMNGHRGWRFDARDHPQGAVLTVSVSDPGDLVKLQGLGFAGVMAYGMHHQAHHLMIATGDAPHP